MKNTFLIYCVIRHPAVDLELFQNITGIDGEQLEFIAYRDLLAVVSPISIENRSPMLSQLYAYENAIASLQSHPAIHSVIPLRYGSFFHKRALIIELLADQFSIYDQLLIELNGCVEMGIRFRLPITDTQKPAPSLEVNGLSGKSYLESVRLRLARESHVPDAIQEHVNRFCNTFAEVFEKYKLECPNDSKNGTGKKFPSLYFLVKKKNIEKFKMIFESTMDGMSDKEKINIILNGPWPPYNFVF